MIVIVVKRNTSIWSVHTYQFSIDKNLIIIIQRKLGNGIQKYIHTYMLNNKSNTIENG